MSKLVLFPECLYFLQYEATCVLKLIYLRVDDVISQERKELLS